MNAAWRRMKIRDICELTNGRAYSKPELLPAGRYRVLRVGNFFTNNHWYYSDLELEESKYCDKGDLLYAWSASFGPRIWSGGKVIYHYHIWKIVPDATLIHPKFLFLFLLWDTARIKMDQGTGTTMIHVSKGSMEHRDIPLPPLPEQQRIVSTLEEAFDGIAAAKANTEKNLQSTHALFEGHLQAVFTNPGDDDCERRSLSDICEISTALVDPRDNACLDMLHVGGANIESKSGALIELKTVKEDGLISGKFAFDETMVLYSKIRPYLMKVARPNFRGLCSADIYPLSAKSGKLDRNYLFYLLLSPAFTSHVNAGSARAGMPKVNRDHLFAFQLYLPSTTKQKETAAKLDVLRAETQRLESVYQQKLSALEALKKSLLHKAFNGEL
jgi:type I restriction enzyme, S subunit